MRIIRYVGPYKLKNVPARDLSVEEAEKYGGVDYLVSSGLYKEVEKIEPVFNKMQRGGMENKSLRGDEL